MTHRTFISVILAAALAVTGMTSTPAQADDRDLAKWIAGAVALGIIGAAIADDRRDDRAVTRNHGYYKNQGYINRGHNNRGYVNRGHKNHGYKNRGYNNGHRHGHKSNRGHQSNRHALPGHCQQTVQTRGGRLHGFGRRCLLNNYSRFNALPHRCAVQTLGYGNRGVIYDSHCLRRHGYQVSDYRK